MSNRFEGFGNVGAAPSLRRVGAEQRPVVDVRVCFDRRRQRNGEWEDDGSFWLTVSVWDARAEVLARVLQKGARVYVVDGELRQEEWTDRETQEKRSELRLTARAMTIDPSCLDSVVYRPRRGAGGTDARSETGPASNPPEDFDPEDIPY